jgi:hypothetical protein
MATSTDASGFANTELSGLESLFHGYDYDYFGSGQLSIYFGDVFIDEIVRVGYDLQHQKIPIYGYASHMFDTVAWGQQIVTGQFAINYKEEAYLQIVLNRLNNIAPITNEKESKHNFYRQNIETLIRRQNQEKLDVTLIEQNIMEQLYGFIDNSKLKKSGSLLGSVDPTKSDFEDIAEAMENQLWGGGPAKDGSILSDPTRAQVSGFDIYLVFGDYSNPLANHTSKKISTCHLTGQSQTIELDGGPVYELYSFIAKGINLPK